MLATIIFSTSVILALVVVILLAFLSPLLPNEPPNNLSMAMSLYIHRPRTATSTLQRPQAILDYGAFIFHRTLTEGPENTSRVVGKAQGFIIPVESFARSDFNVIYLTFDTHEYSGSISVQAKNIGDDTEELTVVGGTGSFAFARGIAILTPADSEFEKDDDLMTCHVKLKLRYPDRSQTIRG